MPRLDSVRPFDTPCPHWFTPSPHLRGSHPSAKNRGQSLGVAQGTAKVQSPFLARAPVGAWGALSEQVPSDGSTRWFDNRAGES